MEERLLNLLKEKFVEGKIPQETYDNMKNKIKQYAKLEEEIKKNMEIASFDVMRKTLRKEYADEKISDEDYKERTDKIEKLENLEEEIATIKEELISVKEEAKKGGEILTDEDRLRLLRERFAKGEISETIYKELKEELSGKAKTTEKETSKIPSVTYFPKIGKYEAICNVACPKCGYEYTAELWLSHKDQEFCETKCKRCGHVFEVSLSEDIIG